MEYDPELVEVGWSERLLFSIILLSFTVLLYDHLLTFANEIEYIWKRRWTPFSVLFMLNRYFAVFTMIAYLCAISDFNKRMLQPSLVLVVLSSVTMLVAEAMLSLRVYAVYNNNKLILGLTLSIWIGHLVTICIAIIGKEGILNPTSLGWNTVLDISTNVRLLFVLPAVVFDAIVGILLTLGLYRSSGPYRVKMPLVRLIIRDGILYFAVVFASNVAWILINVHLANKPWLIGLQFTPMEIWSACITATMIGRLTLNLRMYDPAGNDELTFVTMSLKFT
ncbi:hypothetical protein BDZ94DRAFT_1246411 [Collybia nuda]|uniref:DUF6533 domain-containing protein n=1 Tax=Collybia nuda TaxID=64659 RepID=A0A9P6CPR8_9AGAR|nr:hypothetical protein BDZ94DRAFT_1246411 [Collybia nuda]